MFFSIIIPVYNVALYLRQCVNSVLSQAENDIEILLVDDGSTDESGNICNSLAQEHQDFVRVIHKSNEGLLLTRRRGIAEAKGDWIVHLDSDDYMLPNVLKSIKEVIESNAEVDLVIGKVAYGALNGHDVFGCSHIPFSDMEVFEGEKKQRLYTEFLTGGYLNAMYQKVAKRTIIDFEQDYSRWGNVSIAEDYLQTMPLLTRANHIVFLDLPFVYYRSNPESMTKAKSFASCQKSIWSKLTVFKEEENYMTEWKISSLQKTQVARHHIKSITRDVKAMICVFSKEDKYNLCSELDMLRANRTWNNLFQESHGKGIGKLSYLCFHLIKFRLYSLLRLACLLS